MRMAVLYGASLAVHVALAGGVLAIKAKPKHERVAVMIREVKKAAPKAPAAPEPPKPAEAAPPKAAPRKVAMRAPKAAPAPSAPSAAPAAASSAPESFGLTLGGSTGGDGPALAAAHAPVEKEEVRRERPKVLNARADDDGCSEEPVKPKPVNVVQPQYNDEARAAQVEGKVRVEITVGADGAVTGARVLAGLGHGLDDAALEAARSSTFEPGTRCGKTVAATFTIGMRFSL